jgi:DNA-directed RNA polymerase specialized sigma24 family protein
MAASGRERDDADLIEALSRGCPDALAEAYRRHAACVCGLAGRLCPDQADDLTQAVFLALQTSPGRIAAGSGSLCGHLLAETHRRGVELLRADTSRRDWEARMPPDILEQIVLARTANGSVRRLLAGLPRDQQQAIALAYFGGYTSQQLAGILSLPAEAVNALLLAGMTGLHDTLNLQRPER